MKWVVGLAVLLAVAANPAYAQETDFPASITTDGEFYVVGDTITIYGYVDFPYSDRQATLKIFNPSGAYRSEIVEIGPTGAFYHKVKTSPDWMAGDYRAELVYHGEAQVTYFTIAAKEEFEFPPLERYTFHVGDAPLTLMYNMTGGTIESINAELGTATMTIMIQAESDGVLLLVLPGSVTSIIHPFSDDGSLLDPIVFVDEIEEFPRVIDYSCSLRLAIPFAKGGEQIDIVGTFLASTYYEESRPRGNPVEAVINAENREFTLDAVTNADTCNFSFDQESKKFHAEITGPTHGDGYFQVTLPHHILGGPYTVLVNDEPVEFEEVFSNATRQHTTMISFPYDGVNARTIDIVGTTAIPEFGSAAVIVATLSIASTIAAIRFRKRQ